MDTQTRSTRRPKPLPPLSDGPPPPVPPSHTPPREVPPPRPPEETARSAALWVGGTGAFLLLVAAAVLVAVRWDDLSAWMKLGGLVVTNATVLTAGFRLRGVLPATARALYHLGALLLPISAVAIGVQSNAPWEYTVLWASVLTTWALLVLDRAQPSSALRWVALGAIAPAAGGFGAITSIPAGLVLATLSLAIVLAKPTRESSLHGIALLWAGLSASLAFLVTIDDPLIRTSALLTDLGLGAGTAYWVHAATGLVAAATLAVLATRDNDDTLAIAAIASGIGGGMATLAELGTSDQHGLTAVVAVAVAFELAAMGLRRHTLWGPVLNGTAVLSEVVMAGTLIIVAGRVVDNMIQDVTALSSTTASAGLLLVGSLVAGHRRRTADCQSVPMALLVGSSWWPATVGLAASVLLLAGAISGSIAAVSWTAAGLAVLLVASGRAGGHGTAVAVGALAIGISTVGWAAVSVGAAMAANLAWAAALRGNGRDRGDVGSHLLLAASLLAWLSGVLALNSLLVDLSSISWVAWVGGAALLTVLSERGSTDPLHTGVGLVGRGTLAVTFVPVALVAGSASMLAGLVLLCGLIVLDAMRTGDQRLVYPLAVALPALAVVLAGMAELSVGETGIVLAVLAMVAVAAMVTLEQWRSPGVAVAAVLMTSALLHSAPDLGAFSTTLLILGGAGLLIGIGRVSLHIVLASAIVVIVGFWLRLGLLEITWSEAYLAPVAALLVLSGVALRSSGLRSWWTHGAAVTLLGGAALVERVAGGPGEHSLIAGAVAIVAIMIGAQRRLIGPLVTGTVLVVAVAAHESLAYTARIPTWGWLALGGTALLACGVAIERTATSPLEGGRRVLQTVNSSFG